MNSQLAPSPSWPPAAAPSAPDTFLGPADPFPSDLAELDLTELQVLHSRVCRRLEREYLTDPDGPHPVTQDRCQELAAELDSRQDFLAAPVRLTEVTSGPATVPGDETAPTLGPSREETAPSQVTLREVEPALSPEPVPVDQPMTRHAGGGDGAVLLDLGQVRPGDRVEVWQRGVLRCRGTVEEVCPGLGVAWLLEAGDGYRRMIHALDSELRRPLVPDVS